jgi:hypothetical protein
LRLRIHTHSKSGIPRNPCPAWVVPRPQPPSAVFTRFLCPGFIGRLKLRSPRFIGAEKVIPR